MAKWLMVLPPVLFLGLAGMFYVGMQRSNPDDLPSVFIDREAPAVPALALPGIPGLTAADLRSGRGDGGEFLGELVPALPGRASGAVGDGGAGHPGGGRQHDG